MRTGYLFVTLILEADICEFIVSPQLSVPVKLFPYWIHRLLWPKYLRVMMTAVLREREILLAKNIKGPFVSWKLNFKSERCYEVKLHWIMNLFHVLRSKCPCTVVKFLLMVFLNVPLKKMLLIDCVVILKILNILP